MFGESLPSRERGLKLRGLLAARPVAGSLPSRERGLKSALLHPGACTDRSLPSRERGLKLRGCQLFGLPAQVAPFTGAWIEMYLPVSMYVTALVAPFTGAWIEISCGQDRKQTALVAPFTGAWIEIRHASCSASGPSRSLPSRERGLKWVDAHDLLVLTGVAPFTGAWIEIGRRALSRVGLSGRSFHGSVD